MANLYTMTSNKQICLCVIITLLFIDYIFSTLFVLFYTYHTILEAEEHASIPCLYLYVFETKPWITLFSVMSVDFDSILKM